MVRKDRRKRLPGSTEAGRQMLRASSPNQVESYDFVFDETTNGRRLKGLPVCDEFTREIVTLEVERTMTAGDVVRIPDQAVRERDGAHEYIRSDNGPEFIAKAVVEWVSLRGFKTLFIEPGSPWRNAHSESFDSRVHDDFLNCESFTSLLEGWKCSCSRRLRICFMPIPPYGLRHGLRFVWKRGETREFLHRLY